MSQDSRQSPRYLLECAVTFQGDQSTGQGTMLNLSTGGCAVISETLLHKGEYVGLSVHLPDQHFPVEVDLAAVRWTKGHRCGLEFIRIKQEIQQQLRELFALEEKPFAPAMPGNAAS